MTIHKKITASLIVAAVEENMAGGAYLGYCVKCGAEHEGVEPDAREYECEECNEPAVYGAEELLFHIECHD